ncbi:MAG TPA: hypothetical protein DCS07_03430 [Bdellovibrionales bacterium]|nr:MAG: hypothetical protein A2Z97_00900 [Bdellovibrionales bacterium GWB1_52_6]OFZ05183.1 MAG: hypothetical protein A2X97_10340 [Bdellovibrionales bacterium GWA1_52_35]OFZ39263.1 MAG: hypothetical protein A2070_13215 [Bdellovibrionales bacterium GWC1_52_8]HAR41670.1 hypothetical protein [Bdellovibrionales bacterium]HCM38687.1 hypothetical protein [Bdellovibrionales bacterium]
MTQICAGLLMGFFLSMIPGPAGTIILQQALAKHRVAARASVFAMLMADLIIFLVSAYAIGFFSSITASSYFKISAGLFFLVFAVRAWVRLNFKVDLADGSSTFILTLINPAAWIGAVAFLGLGLPPVTSIAGLELGCALWFVLLIRFAPMLAKAQRRILEKTAIVMVGLLGIYFVVQPAVAAEAPFECREVLRVNQSVRKDCSVTTDLGTKVLHVLELRGDFAQISYDQGYLLAEQVEGGILSETLSRIEKGLGNSPLKNAIFECYLRRIKNSVSKEFLRGVKGLSRGVTDRYRELGLKRKYTDEEVLAASLGVELSNVAEGLSRNMEEDPGQTLANFTASCGLTLPLEGAMDLIKGVAQVSLKLKRGCLGFIVSGELTGGNGMYHARNLDADLMKSWNSAPTLFLIEEPGFLRYSAMASAGDVYPGGVSGLNENGLSVSLHQMSTQKYRSHFLGRRGVMAPYLQQRILREARNLDEAIQLISSTGHFGAWTSLVADARTGEVASVEFSGKRVQVARRVQNEALGQTNHFLGSEMNEQFFTYNYNKQLESESRLQVIDSELALALELKRTQNRVVEIDWVVDHLAGHQDAFEGFRSFGRTATKAYTVMSTVVNGARNEVWLTLGERLPASHSNFVGFRVDWTQLQAIPLQTTRVSRFDSMPNWERSLGKYVQAFVEYEEGRNDQAVSELSEAIRLASLDYVTEYPYYYMRARVLGELNQWQEASKDWEFLWSNREELHQYGKALVGLFSSIAGRELAPQIKAHRLDTSAWLLTDLQGKTPHFDLEKKLEMIRELQDGKTPKLPAVEFVTVE